MTHHTTSWAEWAKHVEGARRTVDALGGVDADEITSALLDSAVRSLGALQYYADLKHKLEKTDAL